MKHHLKHNESCNKALIELDNMPYVFIIILYSSVERCMECWENCWETV